MGNPLSPDQFAEEVGKLTCARPLPESMLRQFAIYVVNAPEEELFRASPLRYAEQAGIDALTAIELFLTATRIGVFDFSWGTLCPSCGAFIESKIGLKYVQPHLHCDLCQLPFTSDPDNAIEISFTLSPEIKHIRFHSPDDLDMKMDWMRLMFSSSISFHPEVHRILHGSFQEAFTLYPGESKSVEVDFEPNHYIFIIPLTHETAHISVREGLPPGPLELKVGLDDSLEPEMSKIGPGKTSLRFVNDSDQTRIVGLHKGPHMAPTPFQERPRPIPPLYSTMPYLTAKQLVTTQTFRNLFPKESIPAEEGLWFNNLTILFTDLKGSTALYDRLGDMAAFRKINLHFDILRRIIAENRGAVVKTMGDAIMASFSSPCDAVVAACIMQTRLDETVDERELELKIGIHCGPVMAVNTNEQLDFFGQTVNIASRIIHAAEPGQILISRPTYETEGVQQAIDETELQLFSDQMEFKGVAEEQAFYRLVQDAR